MSKAATPAAVQTSHDMEVLSPEDQNSTTGGILRTLRDGVRKELGQLHGLDQEARYRALRIGLMCLKGKELCPHGSFAAWLSDAAPEHGHSQVYNFMSLAAVFLQEKKLTAPKVELLCLPDPDANPKARAVVSQAVDWFRDRTLNDLFDEYKIKPRTKKGGAREGAGRKKRGADEPVADRAHEVWNAIMGQLKVEGLDEDPNGLTPKSEYQTWRRLPKHSREKLLGILTDLNHLIRKTL